MQGGAGPAGWGRLCRVGVGLIMQGEADCSGGGGACHAGQIVLVGAGLVMQGGADCAGGGGVCHAGPALSALLTVSAVVAVEPQTGSFP